jgi:hypothetical protein
MDKITAVKSEYRLQQWMAKIEECRMSGTSIKAWCGANNIKIKSYYYWLRKIRKMVCEETETQTIVPVQIKRQVSAAAVTVNIGGIILEIADGKSAETVRAVLEACRRLQ